MFRRRRHDVRDRRYHKVAGDEEMDDFAPAMEVSDSPSVRTVNDILRGATEHGGSAIRIGFREQADGPREFAARYMRGEAVIHTFPLQIEEREKITRRLKLISGIDPLPSSKLEKGQIKLKSGANIQEFLVEFYPEEVGGEILLTVEEIAGSEAESP